jgi:hypothetical protein
MTAKKRISAAAVYYESIPYTVGADGFLNYDEIERVVLTANHNLRAPMPTSVPAATAAAASTTHKPERSLDRQIVLSFASRKPLSAAAAERARQQFEILSEARHSTTPAIASAVRECYASLVDVNGHAAVPRAVTAAQPAAIQGRAQCRAQTDSKSAVAIVKTSIHTRKGAAVAVC